MFCSFLLIAANREVVSRSASVIDTNLEVLTEVGVVSTGCCDIVPAVNCLYHFTIE